MHVEARRSSPEPLWFGRPERPLFGWLHRPPDGRARGAVVLCSPIGIELQFSQYNFGLLARALADAGFVVVRFDYDGTGDSAGEHHDPARVDAWIQSIHHAVAVAKQTGVGWIAGVGLRLGATLLANAAANGAFDALVLWDPCLSGGTFLREQRTLRSVAIGETQAERSDVEIPGSSFSRDAAADLGALELPDGEALPRSVLVLTDPARSPGKRLARRLARDDIEWQRYRDDVSVFDTGACGYVPPRRVLDQVGSWISDRCDRKPGALAPAAGTGGRKTATVALCEDGSPVIEEFVRIGPLGLFGISSEAPDLRRRSSSSSSLPVVLFLSSAANARIGPARQWVELARSWAGLGFRAVRFDFSGIADSPTRAGQPEHVVYASEALDDIADAARFVSPDDPGNVVLVGLCSGALAAIVAAPRLSPRAVVAINPWLTFTGFEPSTRFQEERDGETDGGPRSLPRLVVRSLASLARFALSPEQGSAWRSALGDRLPAQAWSLATKLHLGHSPGRFLLPLIDANVPMLLVCGDEEAHAPRKRTPHLLRRLGEAHRSRFETISGLDHGLFGQTDRESIRAVATAYLEELVPELSPWEPGRVADDDRASGARSASSGTAGVQVGRESARTLEASS